MEKLIHASIDIEALDVDPSAEAGVLAVGIVAFTVDEIVDKAEWVLDAAWTPGTRSKSTYKWWKDQDTLIQQRMFSGAVLPWDFCSAFSAFIGLSGVGLAWGYPVRYDLGHLRSLYLKMEQPFPLNFDRERDMYTIVDAFRTLRPGGKAELDAIKAENTRLHDALADAENQAAQLQHVFRVFGLYSG
jgi:hypothetical protein